jgi:hypothetical protein
LKLAERRRKSDPFGFFFFILVFCCNNFGRSFAPEDQVRACLGWPIGTVEPGSGGASVDRDLKVAKKPYKAPSFQVVDAGAAKAELEASGPLNDENARKMLSVLNKPRDGKPSPPPSTARTSLP